MRRRHRGGATRAGSPPLSQPELAPRFPALDTLRAVGALAVLTTHTSFWSGDYVGNGWLGTLFARLDVGVALFFALSGFLLSRPWFARREQGLPPPSTGRYFWKRFLRIYPVYAITVVIAMSLLADNNDATAHDWLVTLLLADIYTDTQLPAGLTQMWSLATEVAFYLLLPVVMLALVKLGSWRPRRVVIMLGAGCALWVWWLVEGAWQPDLMATRMTLQWLPAFLGWFAVGVLLALVHVLQARPNPPAATRRALKVLGSMAQAPGACWLAAFGVLLLASTPLAGPALLASPTASESLTKSVLYATVAFLVMVPSVFTRPGSAYARLMSLPLLRHLGHISYSLFCIHLVVLHFVMWWRDYTLFAGNGWAIWAQTLVLSLAAAELLYRTVELPAMRLRGLRLRARAGTSNNVETETTTR